MPEEKAIDMLWEWINPPYPKTTEMNIEAIDTMIERILKYLAEKEKTSN